MFIKIKQALRAFKKEVNPQKTKIQIIIQEQHIVKVLELYDKIDSPLGRYKFWKYLIENILKSDYDENINYRFNHNQSMRPSIIYYRKGSDSKNRIE